MLNYLWRGRGAPFIPGSSNFLDSVEIQENCPSLIAMLSLTMLEQYLRLVLILSALSRVAWAPKGRH